MCGIVGTINHTIQEAVEALEAIKHRGPDDFCVKQTDNVCLGISKLAVTGGITDVYKQPFMYNGMKVVANAEIFNHDEIRQSKHFGDDDITSDCGYGNDCAVIAPLLAHCDGVYDDIFNEFDAEFAIIAHDTRMDEVIVARDPHGVRPLFWGKNTTGGVAFASEAKALLGICAPSCVEQFPPGNYMVVSGGCISKFEEYYTPLGTHVRTAHSVACPEEYVRMLLTAAVKKRMMCDNGGVCALLSGGLDSSLVCALASEIDIELNTFSIGMPGSPDLLHAQLVADHIRSNHTSVEISKDKFIAAIPEVIKAIESYDVTTVRASVGNYLIGKYIKEHTDFKVVLNGDYADEVCGGYLYTKLAPNDTEFNTECRRLLGDIHFFDGLRSDRCICAHGLEARSPFADKTFVKFYLDQSPSIMSPQEKPEKYMLRQAFKGTGIIPRSVLWRKKEAFSDGVSSHTDSWHDIIKNYLGEKSEETYYKEVFHQFYPLEYDRLIPYKWMPRFCNATDPSARSLDIYLKD